MSDACPNCGRPVEPHPHAGRPRKFCSEPCSRVVRDQRRKERDAGIYAKRDETEK